MSGERSNRMLLKLPALGANSARNSPPMMPLAKYPICPPKVALVALLSKLSRPSNSALSVFLLLPKFVPRNPEAIQFLADDDVVTTGFGGGGAAATGGGGGGGSAGGGGAGGSGRASETVAGGIATALSSVRLPHTFGMRNVYVYPPSVSMNCHASKGSGPVHRTFCVTV